jgi:hypothetical protein
MAGSPCVALGECLRLLFRGYANSFALRVCYRAPRSCERLGLPSGFSFPSSYVRGRFLVGPVVWGAHLLRYARRLDRSFVDLVICC